MIPHLESEINLDEEVQPIFVHLHSGKIIMFLGPAMTEEEMEDISDIKVVMPLERGALLDLLQSITPTGATH